MQTTINAVVENAKSLIQDDISGGMIPATVTSFAELHEYVDANEYLIDDTLDWDTQIEVAEKAQEILNDWIKGGF